MDWVPSVCLQVSISDVRDNQLIMYEGKHQQHSHRVSLKTWVLLMVFWAVELMMGASLLKI